MSLIKRRQGLILNKSVQQEAISQARTMPGTAQKDQDAGCSLSLCVLAPLCLASMALLWESLYAHRDRTEFKDWPS